jgi:hypothetical protein
MALILQIALGMVLGFVILAYWREILALGLFFAAALVLLALLLAGGVAFYFGYRAAAEAAAASPLMQAVNGALATIAAVLAHFLFGFAVGSAVESSSSLRGREAYIFGFLFFEMFLGSAIAGTWAIAQYVENDPNGTWYVGGLAAAWVSLVAVFWLRNSASKRKLQRGGSPRAA